MCDTPKDLKKPTKRKVPFGDEGSTTTKKKPAKDEGIHYNKAIV